MSMPEDDAQLPLKKRARRRLVGAIALAVLAAVILPMVMDQSPQAPVQDVQIRIPGQDQVPPFKPGTLAAKPVEAPPPVAEPVPAEKPAVAPVTKAPEKAAPQAEVAKPVEKAPEKPVQKPAEKSADKPADKPADKTAAKPADKPVEKSATNGDDARRAAALLAGKTPEPAKPAAVANGEFVILIGAFANPANVKQLQGKLGELGIKVYTEALDSPQGKKTRVRAGPFPSRDAAEKALDRMKRIGVNGVIAAKQ